MTSSRDHRTAAAPRILAAAALALLAPAATGQGWPSARGGGANRGAFDRDDARPIGEPRVAWTLREPGRPGVLGWWGHAAIVEDVDGDGRLEAVVVAGDLAVRPPAAVKDYCRRRRNLGSATPLPRARSSARSASASCPSVRSHSEIQIQ